MSQNHRLNRRAFLKNAGMTALVGAVGTGTSLASTAASATFAPQDSTYDFDEVYDRVGTDCIKWDAQIDKYGRENIAVPMGIADMDFKIAPAITRALRARIDHENYGYLSMPPSYVESIVNWNKRRKGIDINPDLLLHADGVHPAILSSLKAFCPPGSKVIVQAPTYSAFYTDIRIVGCREEENHMKLVNGRYVMDFDDLERRIDHDTNAIILCNPQNPTGNVWSREDLMRLGEICARRRVVVLSDEIHCDFVTKGNTHTPFASLDDEQIVRNSITFNSASKSFNLSAMKCAYLFSTNPDYLDRIRGAGQHRQGMNTLGIIAAQAAYNECEEWLDQLLDYIDGTHSFVESFVHANVPHVSMVKPEGTYLAWLDVSQALDKVDSPETPAEADDDTPERGFHRYLVEHANIHVNPGSDYGLGGSGHMRMNIATSRQLVELALKNMAEALARA